MLHYAAKSGRDRPLLMPDSSPSTPSRFGRQVLIWILKIVVSGGLLYLLVSRVPEPSQLWALVRAASLPWLLLALALYLVMILVGAWRWDRLLRAQHVTVPFATLVNSYLVATFFNNFLPSNIGGDVVRIRDTAPHAGSKTLATTIVLVDRGIGLMGLVLVAAVPAVLFPRGVAAMLRPLRAIHQEWVEVRIERLTTALAKFRDAIASLASGFLASVLVQAILVGFYASIAHALHVVVPVEHIAVVVPLSFIVQMLPVSIGGLGVREATFVYYFKQFGDPVETALALSLVGGALTMLFSISGAVVNVTRRRSSPAAASEAPHAGRT
jgi:glycosyltransferase 2 family protein